MSPLGNGTGGGKTNSAPATGGSAFESAKMVGPIRPVRKWRSAMRSGSLWPHTFAHRATAHAASPGASPVSSLEWHRRMIGARVAGDPPRPGKAAGHVEIPKGRKPRQIDGAETGRRHKSVPVRRGEKRRIDPRAVR